MTTKHFVPECAPGALVEGSIEATALEPSPLNFSTLGMYVSILRAATPRGWGHQEGDHFAHALLSVSTLSAPGQADAVRVVIGRHSFWIFQKKPARRATDDSDVQKSTDASAGSKASGLDLGRFRLRHLRSISPNGWGHDEGDCFARTRFSLCLLTNEGRFVSWRLVSGLHSLWIFR